MRVFILVFLASFGAGMARADVEVIPLKYRNAEQVLPILRPLVEPGGALTGMQNQLVIRASAANIADIRRVLASLDTQPRRLQISVRQDAEGSAATRGAAVDGNIVVRPGGSSGSVNARVTDSRSTSENNVLQTLQVMEGGIATINVGQSVPVPGRMVTRTVNGVIVQDTTSYRDVGTGFQVMPRVSGSAQ
jgi:type II secretory pathway component GspD/PulD (secretin)